MERLDSGYIRGFTAGLQMAKNIMCYMYDDMKRHKRRMNNKEIEKILDCAILHREALRENPDTFIRCSSNGGYEVFDSKRREVLNNEPRKKTNS